eukprot:1471948-Pleurochrysis_carterae.AAC.4
MELVTARSNRWPKAQAAEGRSNRNESSHRAREDGDGAREDAKEAERQNRPGCKGALRSVCERPVLARACRPQRQRAFARVLALCACACEEHFLSSGGGGAAARLERDACAARGVEEHRLREHARESEESAAVGRG